MLLSRLCQAFVNNRECRKKDRQTSLLVDEIHLADDVDEVQDVAQEVFERVKVVHVKCLLDVLHQNFALLLALLQVQGAT